MIPAAETVETPPSSPVAAEIASKAASGALLVAMRGVGTRVAAAAGTLVLARLLQPREIGLLAFGFTLITVGGFLADSGIGAALIRGDHEPSRAELSSVLGFQLIVTALVLGLIAALSVPLGNVMLLAALMTSGLAGAGFRVPINILLERDLSYKPLAAVEVCDAVTFNCLAIGLVVFGFGVWGVALAAAVQSLPGTAYLLAKYRAARVRPSLNLRILRPIFSFGANFQAISLVGLFRDELSNIVIGKVASFSVLGIVTLAGQLMAALNVVFESLWRVSFPAMSQLGRAGVDLSTVVNRISRLCLLVTALLVVGLAGGIPGSLVIVLGAKWHDVLVVLPGMLLGLLIVGPVSTACAGFLLAQGDSRSVLKSTIINTVVAWICFGFYFIVGLEAFSFGAAATCFAEAFVMAHATGRHTGHSPLRPLAAPAAIAIAIGAGAWVVATRLPQSFIVSVGVAAAADLTLLFLYALFQRETLTDLVSLMNRRRARGRVLAAEAV